MGNINSRKVKVTLEAAFSPMKLNFSLFKKNTKNDGFKCKECSMTFQEKERLVIHSRKAHTGREKPDTPH